MNPAEITDFLKITYPFLEEKDIKVFLAFSSYQLFKNKELIIRAGQNSDIIFFILKGMVRGYFLNQKGEEKNIFLRPENTMTAAPESLFENKPTRYNFESVLDSHLLIINKKNFQVLMPDNKAITRIYMEGLQENILTLITRVEALIDKSPEERYEDLLRRSPQFFQTAFHKHIANYLGITAVSLSRIIKRRQEKESGNN